MLLDEFVFIDRSNEMQIHFKALVVLAAGLGATAAAGGSTANVPGEYRLVSVGGQALPVLLGTDDGCREFVTAATLNLRPDGKWTLRQDERHECPSGVRTQTESESGKYATSGATVTFTDDDGERNTGGTPDDDIDLDELDQGTVSGTTLNVRLKEGQALVFQR
jgi:hypothetical protein